MGCFLYYKQMLTGSSFETLEYMFLEKLPDAKTSHLYSDEIIKFTCTFHNLSCKNSIVFKVAPSIPRQPSILIQLLLHSDLKKLPIKFC